MAILPKSARSIKISEKLVSSNYIAIRDIFGHYYLNGQHRVGWPGEYMLGGARFVYKRPYNEPETLEGKGPLQEDLVLEVSEGKGGGGAGWGRILEGACFVYKRPDNEPVTGGQGTSTGRSSTGGEWRKGGRILEGGGRALCTNYCTLNRKHWRARDLYRKIWYWRWVKEGGWGGWGRIWEGHTSFTKICI